MRAPYIYVFVLLAATSCSQLEERSAAEKTFMNYANSAYIASPKTQPTRCATGLSISGGMTAKCSSTQ